MRKVIFTKHTETTQPSYADHSIIMSKEKYEGFSFARSL